MTRGVGDCWRPRSRLSQCSYRDSGSTQLRRPCASFAPCSGVLHLMWTAAFAKIVVDPSAGRHEGNLLFSVGSRSRPRTFAEGGVESDTPQVPERHRGRATISRTRVRERVRPRVPMVLKSSVVDPPAATSKPIWSYGIPGASSRQGFLAPGRHRRADGLCCTTPDSAARRDRPRGRTFGRYRPTVGSPESRPFSTAHSRTVIAPHFSSRYG